MSGSDSSVDVWHAGRLRADERLIGWRGEKELQKVTLNEVAHSIFYAPMYVAIEEGYFREEGIDLTLVTGFGADKTVTAVLAGEADIGFMGSESTIYTKNGGAEDYLINFAQLTQRAGNFLVAREPIEHFEWDMLKGKKCWVAGQVAYIYSCKFGDDYDFVSLGGGDE